jgi:glycosyltransferase involved in cell wall biosynthesis
MRVCLVSSGLEERHRRLQPWHYLFGAALTLQRSGHDVCLVSDGYPRLSRRSNLADLPMVRFAKLQNSPWHGSLSLSHALADLRPEIVLWHLGLTSFLRPGILKQIKIPVMGVFTSPIYQPRELLRLGLPRLMQGHRLSAIHLLGLLVPEILLRRPLEQGQIDQVVVECKTTRDRLIQRGVPEDYVHIIRPDIDPAWFETEMLPAERTRSRGEMGFPTGAFVVGYFGPPTSLRGLPNLIKAIAMAQEKDPRIRLLVLSRRRDSELCAEYRAVGRLMKRLGVERWAHTVTGFLPLRQLVRTIAVCDVVALPFDLVPSDVPLSVLEAMALGIPVITTQVACVPELLAEGAGLCVPPCSVSMLAEAICTLAANARLRDKAGNKAREQAMAWRAGKKSDATWDALVRRQSR